MARDKKSAGRKKRRKKIFYLVTKPAWGGAQRYVYDLAASIPKNEFDVSVITGEKGVLKEKLSGAKINSISVPSLSREISPLKDFESFKALMKIFKEENPDIVHANSSKAGAMGAFAARISGIKNIIFTVHGLTTNEERNIISKIFIAVSYWIGFLSSHKIIAVSKSVENSVRRFPFISGKTTLIHNGIEMPKFFEKEEARRKILGKSAARETVIGTIAELHPNKGISYLVSAFPEILKREKDARLVIIGEGEEKESLKRLIKKKGLQDKVTLAGHIDGAARYLKAFDIFVLPSITEALGYVLLEAGAAGLPVAASDVGGIPEIIDGGKTGVLIPPKTPLAIAAGVLLLTHDKEFAGNVSKKLREKVEKEFTLSEMLRKTYALYY